MTNRCLYYHDFEIFDQNSPKTKAILISSKLNL